MATRMAYSAVRGSTVGPRNGPYYGFVKDGRWTGRVELIPDQLDKPLRWRKPRKVAVALMGDLFHEALADEDIEAVFGVMAACPQHSFQCLTKRPKRMREWFQASHGLETTAEAIAGAAAHVAGLVWDGRGSAPENYSLVCPKPSRENLAKRRPWPGWPLPNVWLGVSVEDQATADERIPFLLQTPAAVRWVSYEPALGPADFGYPKTLWPDGPETCCDGYECGCRGLPIEPPLWMDMGGHKIDWLVIGGESGPGARPCDTTWIRSAVRQCRDAGVACFVKQLGSRWADDQRLVWTTSRGKPVQRYTARSSVHPKGGDPAEWPEDLRIREFPGGVS
jgi:protein gp37